MSKHLEMPELQIDSLKMRNPIIQGGMGVGVSLSGLAAAVGNQGGIGVIAAAGIGMMEPDFEQNFVEANVRALRREIRIAKENTDGVIGVNIMIALTDHESMLLGALDEGVDIVFMGAGLPLNIPRVVTPERWKRESVRIVPIISSGRAAELILKSWARKDCFPAALVVEGPQAGGHLGFKREQLDDPDFALEKLLPGVLEVAKKFEKEYNIKIPVIAGGGLYTGADIRKILDMGADGVQLATRFVTTEECDADIKFKNSYIQASKEDMMIIDSPVGLPGRAVRNGFLDDVSEGKRKPFKCSWKCLRTCKFKTVKYCIAGALTNAKLGKLGEGFVFGGSNAYRADSITTVEKVFTALKKEYRDSAE